MINEIKIYEQGLEEYPKAGIILSNLVMIFWIALGTIACWFLYPLVAWIYLAFAMIMVFVILRKLVCTNCYYYGKWCCIGWGKLSTLFFKTGNIEKFNTSVGLKLAPLTYGLLTIIPLILIVISFFRGFSISKVIVLILLLLISFYSGTLSRKKACANCKMRLICPGSAVEVE
jgi:hypothetical protein